MNFLLLAGALSLAVIGLTWLCGPVALLLAVFIPIAFGIARRRLYLPPQAWMPVALVSAVFMLFGDQAFAQSSTVNVGDIYTAFLPYLVAIVGAVVTVLVGWVLSIAKTKLGISIDDSMRASLQTALRNGAGLALNSLGNNLAGKTVDVKSAAVAAAVTYVAKIAPDAMAHFGLTPDAVAEKIVAHLPQVANTTAPAQT